MECEEVLRLGGGPAADMRRAYRDYAEAAVREGLARSPWEELKEQVVLGGREFLEGLRAKVCGDAHEQRRAQRLRAE